MQSRNGPQLVHPRMIQRLTLVTLMLAGLANCGGPAVTGHSSSVSKTPEPEVVQGYRTLDGKTFETRAARSAYLQAVNDARDRAIYQAELFRQQQYAQSLAGVQGARRQARLNRQEQDIERIERERRQLLRDLKQAERAEQARLRANTEAARQNTEAAIRRTEQALRQSERKVRRAEREQDLLRRADRVARPVERRRARQQRQQPDLPPELPAGGTDQSISDE